MRPEQWDRIQELLDAAALLPQDERPAFLERNCADDPEVRREVESLLGFDGSGLVDHSRIGALVDELAAEGRPQQIGDYRIVRALGEGGMGVVYEAEQIEPVRRRVALKLIRPGLTSPETLARFDNERQALALMAHPNVARVYEAGATEDGQPYFVMEFVEGLPITEHCDRGELSMRERLELFTAVCEGIQHAHQKGILHRDIKPSNVLVTTAEGAPVPKIIDFGVAKLAGEDLKTLRATMATRAGQVVGTLRYMSPEQAAMTGRDVDTRTDVYALGLLLYELLTGRLPFDDPHPDTPLDEILRSRREDDPTKPSVRVKALDVPLARQLRGDLDWIAGKALEKERSRRYAAASELAADVRRYLVQEPILARPPSRAYRIRRFVQRNKVAVASAALIVLALLAGIVATSVALLRARSAEREATELADYMVEVFRNADPTGTRGSEVTLREIVDEKVAEIRTELDRQPATRGRLMAAMAEAYTGLGLTGQAVELLEESLPLLREGYGENHREVLNVLNELGQAANQLRDYEGAARYFRQALPVAERTRGRDHPFVATVLKNLADAAVRLGDLDQAQRSLERALAIRVKVYGEDNARIAGTLSSLAGVLSKRGDHERAIETAQRSLEIRQRELGGRHVSAAYGHYFLGETLATAGRYEDAAENQQTALDIFEAELPENHPTVLGCMLELARTRHALEDDEGAYALVNDAYERRMVTRRPDSESEERALAKDLDDYAALLEELGRTEAARAIRSETAEIRENLE